MKYHHAIIAGRIIAAKPRYRDEIPPDDIPMLLSVLRTLWLGNIGIIADPLDTLVTQEMEILRTNHPSIDLNEEELHAAAILRVESRLRASRTIINERHPTSVVPPSPRPGD